MGNCYEKDGLERPKCKYNASNFIKVFKMDLFLVFFCPSKQGINEGVLTNYLNRALEIGVIEMTLPDKPNNRLQKYRQTLVGENLKMNAKMR